MRGLKRAVCSLLVLVLILGMLPGNVSAASYKNTYKNSGNQRLDIIGAALTQVGYMEGANNANKYGVWYHLDNEPWCAIFVSWCAREAGIPTSILRNASLACPNRETSNRDNHFGIPYYDGEEYTPLQGDLFFTKTFSHVGLVAWVDGEYFYTVEGNSNANGSSNGDRVVCNRRVIKDYYFGVPAYDTTVEPPAAAVITGDKEEYRVGENDTPETVKLTWTNPEDVASQRIDIYKKGDLIQSKKVDLDVNAYTLEGLMNDGYLAVVNTVKTDGSTTYSCYAIDVKEPYQLTMRYHNGGAQMRTDAQYVVTADALTMRAKATSNSTSLRLLTKGMEFTVTEFAGNNEIKWGKTTYAGVSGYIYLNPSNVQRIGYYADENGLIHEYRTEEPLQIRWKYGKGSETGLMDPAELGMSREYYTFLGWSTDVRGSVILDCQDAAMTAETVCPEFRYGDREVDLYAIWQRDVQEMSILTLPEKQLYYTGDPLDTTGLTLSVTYTDGTTETVSEGFTVKGFSSLTAGDKSLTVIYNDTCDEFAVSVQNRMQYTAGETEVTVDGYVGASGDLLLPATLEARPITAIAADAFRDNGALTGILIPATVNTIGDNAFAGCTGLVNVYFTGTQEQWDAMTIGEGNEALQNAQVQIGYTILGDMNGDRVVNEDDAIYLLNHVLFAATYPVDGFTDLTGDGVTNEDDAIYLLNHVLFAEQFPL